MGPVVVVPLVERVERGLPVRGQHRRAVPEEPHALEVERVEVLAAAATRCSSSGRASGSAQIHTKPHRRSQRSSPRRRRRRVERGEAELLGVEHERARAVEVPAPPVERAGDLAVGERAAAVRQPRAPVAARVVVGPDLVVGRRARRGSTGRRSGTRRSHPAPRAPPRGTPPARCAATAARDSTSVKARRRVALLRDEGAIRGPTRRPRCRRPPRYRSVRGAASRRSNHTGPAGQSGPQPARFHHREVAAAPTASNAPRATRYTVSSCTSFTVTIRRGRLANTRWS